MEIINLDSPNIIVVKNFLSDQECDDILKVKDFSEELWNLDFDQNYPKEDEVGPVLWPAISQWQGMCINITAKHFYERYGLEESYYISLAERIKGIVYAKYGADIIPEQYLINRWRVGRDQAPHLDYFMHDEEGHDYDMLARNNLPKDYLMSFEERFQTKHFSSLIYLNEDYKGGELWFPQYDGLTITPEKGMLVAFRGDENTLHGVKMVTEGIRYTVSLFWTDRSKVPSNFTLGNGPSML